MPRPRRVSPDRLLAAAAAEFAARGYAGARVDRIARRARANKAMLYYHFGSKQALYRALLRDTFTRVAGRLRAVAETDLAPADKIDQVIATIADFVSHEAFVPAIMLREIAEGGTHLDAETIRTLAAVPAAVARIVHQGVERQALRPVHPLAAYLTILAPVVMFFGGAPIRKELAHQHVPNVASLTPELFVRELQQSLRLAFSASSTATLSARSSTP